MPGYAIGAEYGIVYLRGEYGYLLEALEGILEATRAQGLLGKDIRGDRLRLRHPDSDRGGRLHLRRRVRAHRVAGRQAGQLPRNRPPLSRGEGVHQPADVVNNVETFCAAARISEQGGRLVRTLGTKSSRGRSSSVSGDCGAPACTRLRSA